MNEVPTILPAIEEAVRSSGFSMPSQPAVGALLRSLAASKPGGRLLELGTGLGLSLAWIAAGMDSESRVWSLENDPPLAERARSFFRDDPRVTILTTDGGQWLTECSTPGYDLIFADTWPGKYHHLDEALSLLSPGGLYVIDDMLPQANWPAGHAEKAEALRCDLFARSELVVTELKWASGVIMAVRR